MRHRIFVVIAAAAAGAACLPASALARGGSGGHGGTASHGAAVVRGARGGVFYAHGAIAATRGGTAAGLYRTRVTARVLTPIRPEVINVAAALGTGGINPPFTGTPIVPPFGAGAAYTGLPVVVTPFAGTPVFGYGINNGVAAESPRAFSTPFTLPVAAFGVPAPGVAEAGPADPNALHGTCHPVPYGYHCDWSS
nr:hypothetical protein [uncultured Rhodopila sp.]